MNKAMAFIGTWTVSILICLLPALFGYYVGKYDNWGFLAFVFWEVCAIWETMWHDAKVR